MQLLSTNVVCLVLLISIRVAYSWHDCDFEDEEDSEYVKETETNANGDDSEGPEKESIVDDAIEKRLVEGLIHYSKTDEVTSQLNNDLELVKQFTTDDNKKASVEGIIEEVTVCTLCKVVGKILLTYRSYGGSKSFASKAVKKLCHQLQSEKVCDGIVNLNIDILLYIMDKKPDLTTSKICSIIAQSYSCKDSHDANNFKVKLLPKSQTAIKKQPSQYDKPLRILHITDIHYDYKYKAGGNTKCGEPLCCGVDQGKASSPENAAGAWGDYRNCDMPLYAVENMMEEASKHDVDFIYHTGDIINHRVWETSVKTNTKSILDVNDLFRKKFLNKTIYHIAGNHEPNPLNEFAPEHITQQDLSTHWLYDMLAEEWSTWLPKDTQPTIRKGGYYTVLVRPGFRIIALNSNVCYVYNWWLLYNNTDPYGQLQWLADTLHQAESNGEIVHILSHVPSGDKECYKSWSREYNKIVRRYADTIKAQFVGHTHFNELHFFYEEGKEDPINVAFNGGSFTTYQNVNPNYRIYDVNPNTYQIENYEDWIFNITEANQHGLSVPPRWYKLYSFKEAYGLKSMNLPELGKLVRSFATNSTLANTYFELKVRHGDPFLKEGCNQKCHEEQLCNLVTSEFGEKRGCDKLVREYRRVNAL